LVWWSLPNISKSTPMRGPAHAEIRLPLQLHMPAGDRHGGVATILVGEGDRAISGVDFLHRHVEHAAGNRRDRQERRIGRLPLLTQVGSITP
jgi:hypothetical protein